MPTAGCLLVYTKYKFKCCEVNSKKAMKVVHPELKYTWLIFIHFHLDCMWEIPNVFTSLSVWQPLNSRYSQLKYPLSYVYVLKQRLYIYIFFMISQIEPTHLDCRECDASPANKIKLRPTLPVRGEDITLRFGTWDDPGAFLANTCELTFKTEEESKWTDVSIQAVCDNNNQLFSPTAFTFTVSSTHSFWGGYAPPPVTVSSLLDW